MSGDLTHILEAYRALFYGHQDAVQFIDTDGYFVEVNEAACRLKRLPREQIIGRHYGEFVPAEDRDFLTGIFEDALSGNPRNIEHGGVMGNGEPLYVSVHVMPLLVDGQVRGIYTISRDITEHRRTQQALLENELMLRAASRTARLGGWQVDLASNRVRWSDEVCAIHEMPAGTCPTVEDGINFYAPESRDRIREVFRICTTCGTPYDEELEIITAGGRRLWVRAIGEPVYDPQGRITQVRGAFQDLSEKKRAEREIAHLESRLAVAMEAMTDAFLTMDREYRYTYVNREAERVLGHKRAELIGRTIWEIFPDLEGSVTEVSFRRAMDEHCAVHYENYYEPLDLWVEVHVYPSTEGLAVYFRDINDRKRAEEEIQFLAFYDPLTGLPNRRLLMDRLQQAMASSVRHGKLGAVLFLDLDHFKTLNDTLGHTEGDTLLCQVADILNNCVRAADTVARFGGDEFVIVLGDLDSDPDTAMSQAESTGRKILGALTGPEESAKRERRGTCSIGVTLFGGPEETVDEVMKRADLAMYQAKGSGRNTLCRFDPDMQEKINRRVHVETELRRALEKGELVAYYQAQLDLDNRVVGAEALVRWRYPERGVLLPAEFVPLAEETGLIFGVGRLVLECVCRDIADWQGRGKGCHLSVAVNVSARQFHHPDFARHVIGVVERAGVDPECIQLELTESSLLVDMDDTIAKMKALKSRGMSFSLDDFGTGYSSLYYLKHLPLDQIKIDQRFVRGVLEDPNDAAIVRAIIALARSLGLHVVAEGVETEQVRDFLACAGCEMFQGYLYSKPVPGDQFERHFLSAGGALRRGTGRMH